MKDEQLADILTYVRNAWGNRGELVQSDQVSKYKAAYEDCSLTEEEIKALD